VSKGLVASYGNGFSAPNLSRMTRLAELFPDREIVLALSRGLGWSHFVEILSLYAFSAGHRPDARPSPPCTWTMTRTS
jgi:hypothetical protein